MAKLVNTSVDDIHQLQYNILVALDFELLITEEELILLKNEIKTMNVLPDPKKETEIIEKINVMSDLKKETTVINIESDSKETSNNEEHK